ncbi:hypothetical protein CP10139811_1605 [Chlamydia ibidis]|uniref:Uncharacterized protein n=1 Tax=Chlamydia ibidis TaxID=1405396 RepID=S7J4J9_9CHLA|nr:hypothetical protein CP10139811_1605 [Chlamydia ibidis]EPP37661.1 hypothetical protein CP10743SC13_1545 [Chlamydia psittaci 10_743_SC13]
MNFLLGNHPFKRISCIFSSEIPHLGENDKFSLRKSPF